MSAHHILAHGNRRRFVVTNGAHHPAPGELSARYAKKKISPKLQKSAACRIRDWPASLRSPWPRGTNPPNTENPMLADRNCSLKFRQIISLKPGGQILHPGLILHPAYDDLAVLRVLIGIRGGGRAMGEPSDPRIHVLYATRQPLFVLGKGNDDFCDAEGSNRKIIRLRPRVIFPIINQATRPPPNHR